MGWGLKMVAAACCALVLASAGASSSGAVSFEKVGKIRVWKIAYQAHDGHRHYAYVALPASYRPGHAPPIPLVISPHGRGVTGRQNVKLWGQLPSVGDFAVISPDGSNYSWGSAGQVSDLARMPTIVHLTLPWVHIAPHSVYAIGGSMGGQETLLLLARHPHLLAGAAAFDPVVNFALQYKEFPKLACTKKCLKEWHGPIGRSLQKFARSELGGSPSKVPYAYELRSPITYARAIAFSGVPLQIWWSPKDRIVIDQQRQAGLFLKTIRKLNPKADVVGYTGDWRHSAEMRAETRLPAALAAFGLLPTSYESASGMHVLTPGPGPDWVPRRFLVSAGS
jgi:pimeloyl-ACP methyl ester carboxylesterase